MKIMKPFIRLLFLTVILCHLLGFTGLRFAFSQVGKQIKWLRVGSLQNWYSNFGSEIEIGRTGSAAEQCDGLRWPAQFRYQDCQVAKAMWIGTTNYYDPIVNQTFPYKVVVVGPRNTDPIGQIMPVAMKMIGRFDHPTVLVDNVHATENRLNDLVDEIDLELAPDRMIVNVVNTSIGITMTRKMMAFAQQNHDNYFIYDYLFKNTGIIDLHGTSESKTLTGVYFHFQYRYGVAHEPFRRNWAPSNNVNWGRNTVNHVVGQNPNAADFEFRAQYSWYGPHSLSTVDDWGAPDPNSGLLGGVQYVGTLTLHADTSPRDQTDDLSQPRTTAFQGSDTPQTYSYDQFNAENMTAKYLEYIAAGHPQRTHAQEVGDDFADQWGSDPGGYIHCQSFGPYTLEPGDSIHIVLAEAVAGISRIKNLEVGTNWFEGNDPFTLPDGSEINDRDKYKELWVRTGEDSLIQTFRRAISNDENGYHIPLPPPPPNVFEVQSGGDRILLSWSENADNWPNFNGYQIFRTVGKPDTLYEKIFECDRANVVHNYSDMSAIRGFDYYYYIQTKDDGSTNDVYPGVPLVSSQFWTMTNEPAYLRRPAVSTTLDSIRVVPNPFNIKARDLQFGIDAPDRLAFYGLPPECTIKIFTERGDLIKTINHYDGTGDELWDSRTESDQVVVSGIYIAYFEVPRDLYHSQTGKLLFKKGQSIFRKFIIIR